MLKRGIIEGFKNLTRSIWLSVTAITVLIVSLGAVTIITTLSTTANFVASNLAQYVTIEPFIKEDVPENRIGELEAEVKKIDGVDPDSFIYYDREASKERLFNSQDGALGQTFQQQFEGDDDLVWRQISITPKQADDYNKIIEDLNKISLEGIDQVWESVPDNPNLVDQIRSFISFVRLGGVILVIIFAVISILVMMNILRITIYSHKEEIEIMRLVGATNNYIRLPFIVEGVLFNIIAASIIVAGFVPFFVTFWPDIEHFFGLQNIDSANLAFQIYFSIATTIIAGILIGVATTYISIQRFLQL